MINCSLYERGGKNFRVFPEYGYEMREHVQETRHRAQNGDLYRYIYGYYQRWHVPLRHISEDQVLQMRRWWRMHTTLIWQVSRERPTYVQIVNTQTPLTQRTLPYDELYHGVLELEKSQK